MNVDAAKKRLLPPFNGPEFLLVLLLILIVVAVFIWPSYVAISVV